ncbi:MAG: hypothetical protein QM635_04125 [Microbacteriaceae bacterium]
MRLTAGRLGHRPALQLFPIALLGTVAYWAAYLDPVNYGGYWISTVSNSAIFLLFSCPYLAVTSAAEASRERRGRTGSGTRQPIMILVARCWPGMLGAVLIQLSGLLLLTSAIGPAPVGSVPAMLVAIVSILAVLLVHAGLGYLLGFLLPVAAALPLSLLVSYCWLGFTWSVSWFPLRYLSGLELVDCCSVSTALDARGPVATTVFCAGAGLGLAVLISALAATAARARRVGVAIAAVAVTVGTIAALGIAAPLGAGPTMARDPDEAICTGTQPTLCLFPELTASATVSESLLYGYRRLKDFGWAMPATLRSGGIDDDVADTLSLALRPGMTSAEVARSLASSLLPAAGPVLCSGAADYELRMAVYEVAFEVLAREAGTSGTEAYSDAGALLSEVQALPAGERLDWLRRYVPSLSDCAVTPPSA